MVAALQNNDRRAFDPVDQAMLMIDAPRPATGQPEFQRLGFADAPAGIPENVANQDVNPFEDLLVHGLPMPIVFPRGRREGYVHLLTWLEA